ncbi:type VI secretion system membrane subunit TssM [Ideonella sp. DXS29W]|uniref:Type VI secretion system membrane subunit TssM n=1 Tax=Ideonella lacteola TaxID=2984193 RepID=A0ABU9BUA5_9BURK
MNRILRLLLDVRVLAVLGLAALAAFLFLGADALGLGLIYAGVALGACLAIWLVVWLVKRLLARRAAQRLEQGIEGEFVKSPGKGKDDEAEVQAVRERMQEAIKTIKTSKLGELTGSAALYELPWYMVIGNPAAGKSTAVVQSGLKFPFSNASGVTDNVIQGIGGTRNCDWFFTNEGILIDTAGRYSVHDEDRKEWLSFLGMLKKNRSKAPINGILIAASVAELAQSKPDAVIRLAKNLRQRVQELTETLEVFAPVYVMFTKADLISGFVEFFEDRDPQERQKAWGATLPYKPDERVDAVGQFDHHFDELHEGLKQLALAHMSLHRGKALPPAVLAFPLEFAATKPALRSFIATLFEDNPYQYRPVFRGFYFTSAVQQGEASSRAREQVALEFALAPRPEHTTAMVVAEHGFFLKDLFSRVVFADRNLVRQHASRAKQRLRVTTFAAGALTLALLLGAWTWSYIGNRQLVEGVRADLEAAVRLQAERTDLASRIEAIELLQSRIEQLQAWRESRPWSVGLGLYQGAALERKLREEYFQGVRRVMLEPVAQAIEGYLGEVNQHADQLQSMTKAPESGAAAATAASPASAPAGGATAVASRFVEASATNTEDAYKALKTYLMLAERQRMESGHLTDQITRFWRGWLDNNRGTMTRERLLRSAETMITFSMANLSDPAFPVINNNFGLVDRTRENLRRVVRGMPAIERVYADVKVRASTRYAPMTVARIVGDKGKETVAGSQVVAGAFTREAWEGYVEQAFKEAANNELQSADWVLKTSARDDLSLQGSPDQIRKTLTDLYKTEYVREWQRFVQGIAVADFTDFDAAVAHMNRLGDPADSPIRRVMTTLFDQTTWDNPSMLNERLASTQKGFVEWVKQSIFRMSPSQVNVKVDVNGPKGEIPMGPVGREFAALSRIMVAREGNGASLMDGYLQAVGKIRTKFNQIKNQGDPGPAARAMMAATLDSGASELAEALRYVDEQMLTGLSDTAKAALRPLLVRPLMQSFAVIVPPTEVELNRLWQAQVIQPFQASLAGKYPFEVSSKVEASPQEVAKVFGPTGAIAKFANESIGPLATRRGETISARTWADMGVRMRPEFVNGFATWVMPLEGAAGAAPTPSAPAPTQTTFQLMPTGAPGYMEYTVEIDGQVLRYRNGAAQWTSFAWPNPGAAQGARIYGRALDGSTVELFNQPGAYGFEKLIDAAKVRKLPDGVRELSWGVGLQTITLHYRAITSPGPAATSAGTGGGGSNSGLRGLSLPALVVGVSS